MIRKFKDNKKIKRHRKVEGDKTKEKMEESERKIHTEIKGK